MSTAIRLALVTLWACCLAGAAHSQDLSGDNMQSLDGQVQEIKSDVLSIASELNNLEERLLYPSNTQIAVFVAVAEDEEFRLDAVQVMINGELATHHIYSFKELEALQKGGVQRIFTGNVPTGEHELEVAVAGKLGNGKDFTGVETFRFSKEVEPKLVGITLTRPGLAGPGIALGNW